MKRTKSTHDGGCGVNQRFIRKKNVMIVANVTMGKCLKKLCELTLFNGLTMNL